MVWLGEKRAQRVLGWGYLLKVHLASRSRASCRPRAMKLSQAGARHGAEPRCLLPSCSSSRTPRSPRHADPCETHPNPTTSMCCADGNRRALLSAGWEGFSAPRLLLAYHFCEMIHLPHTEVTKTRRSYTGDNPVPMKGEGCLRPCGTPLPAKPPPPGPLRPLLPSTFMKSRPAPF